MSSFQTASGRRMYRVLVADDHNETRELVRAALEEEELLEVVEARDGREAIEVARQARPALVFLDLLMPLLDGFEVCQALREDPATRETRVVVLTAVVHEPERRRAMELGAAVFLPKPCSVERLLQTARGLLEMATG